MNNGNSLDVKESLKNLKRVSNADRSRLDYLRLDKNENILSWPAKIRAKLYKELSADFISAYPEVDILYNKLAKRLGVKKENIFLTAGSDAAIKAVFEVFVKPGDHILTVSPTYAMFYVYAKMFAADLKEIFYDENLSLAVNKIKEEIARVRPKLVCIANPNSPTGTVIAEKELEEIIALCSRQGSVILMDEAYYMYYPKTTAHLIGRYDHLVITRTFSKAFGLASARLGYALGSPTMIGYLAKTRPMYETNAYALKMGEIILDNFDAVRANLKLSLAGKKYLETELKKLDLPFFKSHANFVLIDLGSKDIALKVAEELKKKKILVKTGFGGSPLERCIRVNIGHPKQMKLFIDKLKQILKAKTK